MDKDLQYRRKIKMQRMGNKAAMTPWPSPDKALKRFI